MYEEIKEKYPEIPVKDLKLEDLLLETSQFIVT